MTTYGDDLKTYVRTLVPIYKKIYEDYANGYGSSNIPEITHYMRNNQVHSVGSNMIDKHLAFMLHHNYVILNTFDSRSIVADNLRQINSKIYSYKSKFLTNDMIANVARQLINLLSCKM